MHSMKMFYERMSPNENRTTLAKLEMENNANDNELSRTAQFSREVVGGYSLRCR